MKKNIRYLFGIAVAFIFVASAVSMDGCKNQVTSSLYNPSQEYLPNPVIDSLSPTGSALAGVDTVTLYGKNFSGNKDSDLVYFIEPGTGTGNQVSNPSIINATSSKLTVKAPALSGDSIQVRVAVIGALLYGTKVYQLIPAISQFGNLGTTQAAYGVCAGADTSLYAAISSNNVDRGVFKVTSAGTNSYAPATSGLIGWNAIKFGPGGYLYAVRGNRAVYRFAPGGGTAAQVWASATSGSLYDMDFDADLNLWVGGNASSIYRIKQDASVKGFTFSGTVRSLRYYNGYLYFAANVGTAQGKVYRAPIVSDSLGTPEVYFDLGNDPTGGNNIYAITFSADGNMYAGVDSSDYLIVVHPGGFIERPYTLYASSGGLSSPCRSFAWIGINLYASTLSGQLLQIVARKQGTPYYGIQ